LVAAKADSYAITGEVIDVVMEKGCLIVRHEAIPGYMPAMTMEFGVEPGDLQNARRGSRISATMIPSDTGDFRLIKIWPAGEAAAVVQSNTQILVDETTRLGRGAYREVGAPAPAFALFRQDGDVVASDRFRGRQVMLNFIFTRCPVATMCPAAVARFQQVQQKARALGVGNLELVSISLDPVHDTPGVLREYARSRSDRYLQLLFPDRARMPPSGPCWPSLEFWLSFRETCSTIRWRRCSLTKRGRIAWRADGSSWSVDEFVSRLKR
jgi:protein SCO1/2